MQGLIIANAYYYDQPNDKHEYVPSGELVDVLNFVGENNEYAVIRYMNRNRIIAGLNIRINDNLEELLSKPLLKILCDQGSVIVSSSKYEKIFKFIANELPCYCSLTTKHYVKNVIENYVGREINSKCELVEAIEGWKLVRK